MTNDETTLDYDQQETIIKTIEKELTTNWAEGLKSLQSYNNHHSEELKRDLLAMAWRFALRSSDPVVRQQLVNHQLHFVINATQFLKGQALKFLQDFSPSDFDKHAIERLKTLSWSGDYGSEIIRLIGIADVRSKIPDLQKVAGTNLKEIKSPHLYATQSWGGSLVLARFGDPETTKRVIEQVKNEPDIVLRATRLFAHLAYTRQPLAYNTLRFFLHSQERLPQVKETVPGQPEALYAAALFAEHIEGCPVTDPNVEEKDMATIRQWTDVQTDWHIRD